MSNTFATFLRFFLAFSMAFGSIPVSQATIFKKSLCESALGHVKNLKDDVGETLSDSRPLLGVFAIPFLAAATGGDLAASAIGAALLYGGINAINLAIDKVVDTFRHPEKDYSQPGAPYEEDSGLRKPLAVAVLTTIIAASTNGGELLDALIRFFDGAGAVSAAVPIGSNSFNVIGLVTISVLWAWKERVKNLGLRVVGKTIDEEMKTPSFREKLRNLWGASKTMFKSFKFKEMEKPAAIAAGFMGMALWFQVNVLPSVQMGEMKQLYYWLAAAAPTASWYIGSRVFSKKAKLASSVEGFSEEQLAWTESELEKLSLNNKSAEKLKEIVHSIRKFNDRDNPARAQEKEQLKNLVSNAVKDFTTDPEKKAELDEVLNTLDEGELNDFLNIAGVPVKQKNSLTRKEKMKVAGKILAWLGVIIGSGFAIESGVTSAAESFNMNNIPAWVNFPVLVAIFGGFATSAGEFKFSRDLIAEGKDGEAVQNIAISNGINILIATLVLSLTISSTM